MERKVLLGTHEFGPKGIGNVWSYFTAVVFFGYYSSFLTFFAPGPRILISWSPSVARHLP